MAVPIVPPSSPMHTSTPPLPRWFGIVGPDGTPKYALADGFCPVEARLKEEAAALEREASAGPASTGTAEVVVPEPEAAAEAVEDGGAKAAEDAT